MSPDSSDKGRISWIDLTVENAEEIREFYSSVIGWSATDVPMDGYNDYCMNEPENSEAIAGICHAKGQNSELPSQWLVYVLVEDIEKSMAACIDGGGKVIAGPNKLTGTSRFSVIQDPAGAVMAIYDETKLTK